MEPLTAQRTADLKAYLVAELLVDSMADWTAALLDVS